MNPEPNPEIAALKQQVFTLKLALIVVAGTLATFLYWQTRIAGKDLEAIKPQAKFIIGSFNQNQAMITTFENQLVAYGQKNPEFRPILMKYGLMAPPAAAPAAPAKPAAAPAAPAPKK